MVGRRLRVSLARFLRLGRDASGAVVIEFAIVLPLLAAILLFLAQTGEFQLERLASTRAVSNGVMIAAAGASEGATPSQIANAVDSAIRAVAREGSSEDYRLYVRAVRIQSSGAVELWAQQRGSLEAPAQVVVAGGILTLPQPVSLEAGDRVFIVEFFRRHGRIAAVGATPQSHLLRVLVR